jgi:hypothetical protein
MCSRQREGMEDRAVNIEWLETHRGGRRGTNRIRKALVKIFQNESFATAARSNQKISDAV